MSVYGNTCTKLDRAFVLCPSSMLLKPSVTHSVVGTPEQVFAEGESDHAPVALGLGRHSNSEIAESPIPRWVTKHPNFKVHLNSLTDYVRILALNVSEQLLIYKSCMREAARRVRNEALYFNPDGSAERKIVLSSISRALWFTDLPLARKLLRWSSIAKDLMHMDDCKVLAYSYENFEQVFGDFYNVFHRSEVTQLQTEIAATDSLIVKKQFKSRLQCARRMQGVFWKTGKRLKLSGIQVRGNDGQVSIVSSPQAVQQALATHWSPIYGKKQCDSNNAKILIDIYGRRHRELISGFGVCSLPGKGNYIRIIKKVKDSACGPDGVPYSAYSADLELSGTILENTSNKLAEESEENQLDLEQLNRQLCWFAPKGVVDQDSIAVLRTPENLRTIFGGNADAKLISGAISFAITEPALAITPAEQRGFCRGRQLSLNVVDLDTYMRAFNLLSNIDLAEEKRSEPYRGNIGDIPASMLYDFCNAFPTLLHEWLWLVLEVLKIPTVIVKVIERLYSNIFAYSSGCGDGPFLFEVLGGVKTGCPLSSILFLLGVHPFIDLFLWLSDGPKCSVTRICADDFGSALKCLKSPSPGFYFPCCCEVCWLDLEASEVCVGCYRM